MTAREWLDPTRPAAERARALLARMSVAEKVAQLVGVWVNPCADDQGAFRSGAFLTRLRELHPHGFGSLTRPYGSGATPPSLAARQIDAVQRHLVQETRLGIPALVHEECLTGLMVPGATVLPTPLAWAATFCPEDVEAAAAAVGTQMAALGVHLGLAPVLDVVRDHRYGRVEECLGEDPLLVSSLGAAYVRGLQSAGVGACAKHFVGHGAPEAGHNCGPVHAGWRELSDVHLPPFAAAVAAGVSAVMSGYHDVDGDPVTGSPSLLRGILRDRFGFDGLVVSDYWALNLLVTHHRVAEDREGAATLALEAGVDLELPDPDCVPALAAACEAGRLPVDRLDAAVSRVLEAKFRLGVFERPFAPDPDADLDPPAARAAARRLAERSVTMLQNDGTLPLRGVRRIALVGPWADDPSVLAGDYSWPNHVGYRAERNRFSWGPLVPTFLDALRLQASTVGAEVVHVPTCRPCGQSVVDDLAGATWGGAGRPGFADDPSAIVDAAAAAAGADVAVVVVGDRSGHFGTGTVGEGTDRDDLRLPGHQEDLVSAVLSTGTPTVVVVTAGRALDLGCCSAAAAVLCVWIGGEEGADALARVLVGRLNPSGRCPVTFGGGAGQQPLYHASRRLARRHYLDRTTRPRFAFGHGLGYSPFSYHDVEASAATLSVHGAVDLAVTVRNDGELDGEEVVQVYVHDHAGQVARPVLQLLAFERVAVAAGAAARVVFTVPAGALAYAGRWERIVEPGTVTFWVGASASDLRLSAEVEVVGESRPFPLPRQEWVSARVTPADVVRADGAGPVADVPRDATGLRIGAR